MNKSANTGRDSFFDLLKAFAIFLVIFQHMISCLGEDLNMWDTPAGKVITMFNMPLFMFVVGYFSLSAINKPFRQICENKWETLLRPMIPFCIILIVIGLAGGGRETIFQWFKFIYAGFVNSYWFIWSAITCILWSALFLKLPILKKWNKSAVLFCSLVCLLLIPILPITFHLGSTKAMYPFFILGLICREEGWMEILRQNIKTYLLISTLVLAICYTIYTGDRFFYSFPLMSSVDYAINYALMLFSGLAGIIFSICFMQTIYNPDIKLIKWLTYVGQYTFLIYMEQQIIVKLIYNCSLDFHSQFLALFVSVVVFILLSWTIKPLTKYSFTQKYMLGKINMQKESILHMKSYGQSD